MSRRRIAAALALFLAVPAVAQDGQTGEPPERIDLTITTARPPSPRQEEECRRQREAAIVTGEIVVCGSTGGEDQRITSREEAQDRYAAATQGGGTPDVAGPGIFRGAPTVSGLCIPGIFNCPKPPALIVDVTALPQAPPGSDADRIARGLEPLGEDERTVVARQVAAQQRAELGLPDPGAETGLAPAPDPRVAPGTGSTRIDAASEARSTAPVAADPSEPPPVPSGPNPAGSAVPGGPR